MSTAGRPRPARSATCAWRAARCSSTPSAMITDVIEDAFAGDRLHAPPTSTGSCRTRPTSASSTARAHKLGIAPDKVVITVDRHGNTSAASIPLALAVAVADGRIKRGDLMLARGDGRRLYLGRGAVRW